MVATYFFKVIDYVVLAARLSHVFGCSTFLEQGREMCVKQRAKVVAQGKVERTHTYVISYLVTLCEPHKCINSVHAVTEMQRHLSKLQVWVCVCK